MHFLQTAAWENFQKSLGRTTFRQSGKGWEYLAILEHGTGDSRLYCPYGPFAENAEAFKDALKSLVFLAKSQNVTFVRIEPTDSSLTPLLSSNGWKKVTYQSLNPEHTHIINLQQSEEEIISQMSQPARNVYRNYSKKGFHVKKSHNPTDIHIFLELIHQVADRTNMRPHSDAYFMAQADSLLPSGSATLWYAELNRVPIASALLYDSPNTRYYAHAAASSLPEHRKLNASTAIVAEAIIDAKRKGLATFDLYGIAPDDSPDNHPWKGFTRFKRSFGGEDLTHAGSWDLPIKTLAYYLYRAYQKARR
ncbi:hypothetical protein B7Y94_02770 [Candidatus Saccharibacteria bacterium 32-49-12]|nr:MAG: hypothetical protein B7Y94_02770 [Candidatus Saccharibacteria bacterium 32-49-12]